MSDRDTVIAWLRENDWRYSKAARRFDLPKEKVTQWGREARGLAEPASEEPTSRARATDLLEMDRESFLRWQLDEALGDLATLQGMDKAATALSNMHRTIRDLRVDLDDERQRLMRERGTPDEHLTPEEHRAAIRQDILDAEESVIEVIEAAIHERRNPIRLVR